MTQQVPQDFNFPLELPRARLERFDPLEVVHVTELAAAELRLQRAGLVSSLTAESPLEIVGGRSRRDAGGFFVYEDGFVVSAERDDGFLAEVTGSGNLTEQAKTNTLAEAVDFVIDVFRHRAQRGR
jgi:hypothetical protein